MANKIHFGKRISVLRRKAGLSQTDLAEKLGVTSQAVSKWECGNAVPDIDILLELSHLYKVTINEMLEDVDTFSRLVLKFSLEGGTIMNYRIETKPQITLLGYKRHFEGMPYDELRYKQEENFFVSTRAHQWMLKGMANDKLSDYCVLTNMDDNGYDFYISVTADKYEFDNLYNSDVTGIDFMEKFQFEKIIIPERTYAVFETEKQKMPIPEYFDIRKQIAAEWLSNEEYQMINAPELAVYHWGIVGGYTYRTIEIWIPIEKK